VKKLLFISALIIFSILIFHRCVNNGSDNCPYNSSPPFVKAELPDSVKVGATGVMMKLWTMRFNNMEYFDAGFQTQGDTVLIYSIVKIDDCERPLSFKDTSISVQITFSKVDVQYFKYYLIDSIINDTMYFKMVMDTVVGYE
jgi:hypothetical protein